MKRTFLFSVAAAALALLTTACTTKRGPRTVDWLAADLPAIDSICGAPRTIATPLGNAVAFDGTCDAFYLGTNPLQGMEELTVEVIFRQDGDAAFEQRFLHMGTVRGERIMVESRVDPDRMWYLDTSIRLDKETDLVLIDPERRYPTDRWYNLAMVVADGRATSYVNGEQQLTGEIPYRPISEGITSVGVRQNKVCWFKGALYRIRITPRALRPDEMLTDYKALNGE